MADVTDPYVALLTSEHRDRPRFQAAVRALTRGFADGTALMRDLISRFDLDTAHGDQLDSIGLWVGMSRRVATPLTGVYFTWDDTAATGWENGYWKGEFDPANGLTVLDDETYRTLIRAQIAANIWDGTLSQMYEFWDLVFGPGSILIQDDQNMSITLIYDDVALSTVQKALFLGGYFPLKPEGVRVNYLAASSAPVFSWDRAQPKFQGWTGASVWL